MLLDCLVGWLFGRHSVNFWVKLVAHTLNSACVRAFMLTFLLSFPLSLLPLPLFVLLSFPSLPFLPPHRLFFLIFAWTRTPLTSLSFFLLSCFPSYLSIHPFHFTNFKHPPTPTPFAVLLSYLSFVRTLVWLFILVFFPNFIYIAADTQTYTHTQTDTPTTPLSRPILINP